MAGFNYEKNLPHQEKAINAVLNVFKNSTQLNNKLGENPTALIADVFNQNIKHIQQENNINVKPIGKEKDLDCYVLDIMMETGTGKTYTYTKTMFELHKNLGIYKFVIVVPTLSIKAGTQNFLQSEDLRKHFKLDFLGDYNDTDIELYLVESQKNKNKKYSVPSEIIQFINAINTNKIHVLLINQGMLNSKTLDDCTDGYLIKDNYNTPIEGIASVKPFVILDEPHKFKQNNKTWQNILKLKPQYILRYGATFPLLDDKNSKIDYRNLLYRLTAIDAFNQDLVKGVNVFIEEVSGDSGVSVSLKNITGTGKSLRAEFELAQGKQGKQIFSLTEKESLHKIHPSIVDLFIDKMNKSTLVLSNGVELNKGMKFDPYSYSQDLTDKMLRVAIHEHFKLEKKLLTRPNGRIKPLTLFFIDDIKGYREGNDIAGSLKTKFEQYVKAEIDTLLQQDLNDKFKQHLIALQNNIDMTHGGYFSQDNSDSDEKIAKEVDEILHDKQALLSLDNPRRFIFSKWTLREGWDNPNVFGICKLRSSGSEISKLQEVGRGLRLPVNEYGARVKDLNIKLNYFVDNSEKDFVEKLIADINKNSEAYSTSSKLTDELINKIIQHYPSKADIDVRFEVITNNITDKQYIFTEGGKDKLKSLYPKAFNTLEEGKIKNAKQKNENRARIRAGKYDELKSLWEKLNERVILQYKINHENEFLALFVQYLRENKPQFTQTGFKTVQKEIEIYDNKANCYENESIYDYHFSPIITMSYAEFLQKLAENTLIKMSTLHQAFHQLHNELDITKFLNIETIQKIKKGFNQFLLFHSFTDFNIGFNRVESNVHPTRFTDEEGRVLKEIDSADLGGVQDKTQSPFEAYLFDQIFYDSQIELADITESDIQEITVFTKIPKKSIKIPVAGGGSYSPDFAYIIKKSDGEILNLVVESKGVENSYGLRSEEQQKIKHAEFLFKQFADKLNIKFVTQFNQDKIVDLIRENI